MINIEGLDKATVLAALYNAAKPQGMGFLHYDPNPMTMGEAAELLAQTTYFDYLKGRVMKVSLQSDTELNERLYDRDNGVHTASNVIHSLRASQGPDNNVTQFLHQLGVLDAADAASESMMQPTTIDGGTITLGLDAGIVGPAVEAALESVFGGDK